MKIYILEKYSPFGFGGSKKPITAFNEMIDAMLAKEDMENNSSSEIFPLSYGYDSYDVVEIELHNLNSRDSKRTRKYAQKMIAEIDVKMKDNAIEQDLKNKNLVEENEKLALEKDSYKKFL